MTAGYVTPGPREEFFSAMDAANVDLKAFTDDFYHALRRPPGAGAGDPGVLKQRDAVWIELTTLLIPGRTIPMRS